MKFLKGYHATRKIAKKHLCVIYLDSLLLRCEAKMIFAIKLSRKRTLAVRLRCFIRIL
jgi:hypothetical protein